jgi:flagellar hook-length control protein FliK
VLSVSSEAVLSAPAAPSRSARPDQAAAPDGFSALIDNAAGLRSDDRPAATASDRQSPQQYRDEAAAAPARDSTASDPQAAQSSDAPAVANPGATVGNPSKSEPAKPTETKAERKDAASDVTAPADVIASTQAVAAVTDVVVPIAVAIAAPAVTADARAQTPDAAPQPLAIAAAAIATTTSTIEASNPATTPVPIQIDQPANAAATAASFAAGPPTAMADTPPAGLNEVATPQINPVKSDIALPADPAVAAAPATATSVAVISPKVIKPATGGRSMEGAAQARGGNATDDGDPPEGLPTTDTGKSIASQDSAPDDHQKAGSTAIPSVKTDTARPDTTVAAATPREHHSPAAPQLQAATTDAGQIANVNQQPVQPAITSTPAPQLTVTASNTAAVPLNGLALQIAVTAQSGSSRFEIRLDPAELGRIDVRIDLDRHGQITSHLTVEKPETLAMLRQDAPQLQRALDNAGFRTGDHGLQFSLRDQSSSNQNGGSAAGGQAHRLIISEDDVVPVTIAGRTYGRVTGQGGGVDIRV